MRTSRTIVWLPAALFSLALLSFGSFPGCGGATGGNNSGGSGGDEGGSGGSDEGGSGGGSGGKPGTGGTTGTVTPPAGAKLFKQMVITFYSFQDNTPVNSLFTSSNRLPKQYSSIAVPSSLLKKNGGTLNYGDKLWLSFLAGRTMPN